MKFAVAALAVLSGVASASAADLAPHSYTKVPIAAPNTDWSGFYVGVTAGYGWGNASAAEAPANSLLGALLMAEPGVLPSSLSPKMSNGIGGGEIGYSWQFGRVVAASRRIFPISA
jgi:outer membrane immunogenic protein